jgi:predicted RNA methylase
MISLTRNDIIVIRGRSCVSQPVIDFGAGESRFAITASPSGWGV